MWVLQHYAEARSRKVIGTSPLLQLCLKNIEVTVDSMGAVPESGEAPLPELLKAILRRPGTLLLYPGEGAIPLDDSSVPVTPEDSLGDDDRTLVVLDGTWRQARQLMTRHPILRTVQRCVLTDSKPSLYGTLRRATVQVDGHVSTCEAVGRALRWLEPEPETGARADRAICAAMAEMVQQQQQIQYATCGWYGTGNKAVHQSRSSKPDSVG